MVDWNDSDDVNTLLDQVEIGNDGAFGQVIGAYRSELIQYVGYRIGPSLQARVDASDVVQEACYEATIRLHEFLAQRPMPVRLWLRKLTYERLLTTFRRHLSAAQRSVYREAFVSDDSSAQLLDHLVDKGDTPSEAARRQEGIEAMRQALAELDEDDREVLLLRATENMPYDAIALVLDCKEATARQRYARALSKLSKHLEPLR